MAVQNQSFRPRAGDRTSTIDRCAPLAAWVSVLSVFALFLPACQPGTDTPSGIAGTTAIGGGGSGGGTGAGGGEACDEGDSRDCHITLGEHNGVLSCFDGVQTCKGGVWSACEGQSGVKPPPPPATACDNNPCDPTCQAFKVTPNTPIGSPPVNLIAPWLTGNYGGLPQLLIDEVSKEPCSDGSACQQDQYCNNPASGSCAHNKCVTGAGLLKSCDPDCVTKICNGSPGCCSTPIPAAGCPHDLCATGAALQKTGSGFTACDPCVNTVCALSQYQHCCDTVNGAWTAECVERAITACGKNCSTGSWDSSCVAAVDTFCNAKCLEDTTPPTCAHDPCLAGDGLDHDCDTCVGQICDSPGLSGCCSGSTGAWNGNCVQAVATVCNKTCPKKGDCVPWLPTQKDLKCGGAWDLTVGTGCTNGGVKTAPVCNRGQSPSPAGLVVGVFPSSPVLIPGISPDMSTAIGVVTLPSIAAGQCANVDLPAATPDGAQLMVNPTTDPSYITFSGSSECHNNNNWGVWSSATGQCANPSCAGASAFSKLKKIKLFFAVDVSSSMNKSIADPSVNGTPSRWTALRDALTGFLSTAPDDLGVWIRFWPNNDAVAGPCPAPSGIFSLGCGPVPYCKIGNADVNDLTAANELTVTTAINSVGRTGNTPMYPVLDATTQKAVEFQVANPDWASVVILVTDGSPSQCTTNAAKIAALAGAAYNGYDVRTYTIGMSTDLTKATTDLIASTGGGKSFYVNTNDQAQFSSSLNTALDTIRQDFVSCTLPLPNQNLFDPTQAVITYTPGVGMPAALPEVANAGACAGDGWYYDDPAAPTTITLCPTTCSNVKLDTNGKLEMNIACIQQYQPSTFTEVYQASCPAGTSVQWGFFAYDTTTPGDSKIDFYAQTSPDNVTFSALQAMPISTASATAPNVQICPMGGPSPCPVDLYNALGGLPKAQESYLKLVADITPTSDQLKTPVLNNWQVTYSCPDSE